jgi:hypothetical protein
MPEFRMTLPSTSRPRRLLGLLVLVPYLASCAAVPYEPGHDIEGPDTMPLRPGEAQIERGRPVAFIDGLGHYVLSLPTKLLLWNWKVDNHDISPGTEECLRQYLAANDLHEVKVRLNEYAPGSEWRRLFDNKAINGFWRYTIGLITVTFYTILPGRLFAGLFGGDNYNPYTNTINLYSDHPAIALHEAGHAKDFAEREYKGVYGAVRLLPIVPLYQEGVATGDVIGYDRALELTEDEKAAYKVLYPAYATYIVGEGLRWVSTPWAYPITIVAVIPAHIIGRIKAAGVEDQPAGQEESKSGSAGQNLAPEPFRTGLFPAANERMPAALQY